MKLTIQSQEEKPLMHRTDYIARVEMGGATPTRVVLVQALSREFKVDAKLVVVRQINPVFGEPTSVVHASVYKKVDALEQYEGSYMTKRHAAPKKEEKPAEAPKEKSTEDTPKEKPAENASEESKSSEEKPKEETPKEAAPEKHAEEKAKEAPAKEPKKEGEK